MESFDGNQVVGFWHEDSFIMNLLLREVTKENCKMSVLVTGDPRGDYIQYMIEKMQGRCSPYRLWLLRYRNTSGTPYTVERREKKYCDCNGWTTRSKTHSEEDDLFSVRKGRSSTVGCLCKIFEEACVKREVGSLSYSSAIYESDVSAL